jgi:DNA-directed RNA polymerase specialized sigma24 family protein
MIAVEEVFNDWNRRILSSLRRRFPAVPVATLEDGAAFAWERLATKPPAGDENVLGWLIVVARHEVLKLLRRWDEPVDPTPDYKRERKIDLDWRRAELATANALDDELEAREVVRRVNELRPQQRIALTCRLLGLSYKEAQQATGHTYTWVNRHIVEGRRALVEELEVAA